MISTLPEAATGNRCGDLRGTLWPFRANPDMILPLCSPFAATRPSKASLRS